MDSRQALLAENEGKRLTIKLPLLICFAMFAAWQMGVIYFSGQSLSVDGRTPLPVTMDGFTIIIIIGYILSISWVIVLPHFVVWAQRITAGIALLSAIALFIPFPVEILGVVFYIHCFCCVFLVGFEGTIITYLFKEETAVRHLTLAYAVAMFIAGILQNDVYPAAFPVFRYFMVIATALQLLFYCKMPGRVWPRFTAKTDGLVRPGRLFLWVYVLCFVGSLMIFFGIAISETVRHGVMVNYIATAIAEVVIYVVWKRYGISALRMGTVGVASGALGTVLAILSLQIPALALPACAMLGIGSIVCLFLPLFGLALVKVYPTRFVTPMIIGLAFSALLVHTALLEAFRDNHYILYISYLVIAVGLGILYLVLEPYLSYSFRGTINSAAAAPKTRVALPAASGPERGSTTGASPPIANWREMLQANACEPLLEGELDIAGLIMLGYKNDDISKETRYTLNTVKSYRKELYSKLQIHETRELFMKASKIDSQLRELLR